MRSHSQTIFEAVGRGPVHPFPARMAPGIALDFLEKTGRPLRVLDPMMGSGTVLAVARSKGHRAIGVDIDPLAVLLSSVWTRAVDVNRVRVKTMQVLKLARGRFKELPRNAAYPWGADDETKRFVRYWFDSYARRQLASLAAEINRVRDRDVREVLWCGFSRLIIAKQAGASLAMDLSHSRPHRVFNRAPQKPFRAYQAAVDRVLEGCLEKNRLDRGPAPRIFRGDARQLPLRDASIDLVLTSPPYLNAIDYVRCSKFSLVWMGYTITELRLLRRKSVGTEVGRPNARDDQLMRNIKSALDLRPRLNAVDEAVLNQYIVDMRRSIAEVARVLTPRGKAVYVIGENTTRGTYVRNSLIATKLAAKSGLRLIDRRTRRLPSDRRYLPPPTARSGTAALDARIRREVVLVFAK